MSDQEASDSTLTDNRNAKRNELAVGKIIDNFVIEAKLGSGGYGTVYAATDTLIDRRVAIKVFHESGDRVLNEPRKMAKLRHKNLVEIHQVMVGEPSYLVMELIEGCTLSETIDREGPIPWESATNIAIEIGSGLAEVHRLGIVHLDVKPRNILIESETGRVVLTDFGIAISHEERWTSSSGGTLSYMAPEQIECRTEQFDGRTDIWAVGVVLYQMLAKRLPFGHGLHADCKNLKKEICTVHPPAPSQWETRVPQQLDQICLKCLSKGIRDRYGPAAQLIKSLKRTLAVSTLSGMSETNQISDDALRGQSFVAKGCLAVALIGAATTLCLFGVLRRGEFDAIIRNLFRIFDF